MARLDFEDALHVMLLRMVDRLLMALPAHVRMDYYPSHPLATVFEGGGGLRVVRLAASDPGTRFRPRPVRG